MQLTGWGKYPAIDSSLVSPLTSEDIKTALGAPNFFSGIARGMGRSYGDSSLASQVINTRYLNHLISFDDSSGLLRCSAGITLDDLLRVFVPRGWFLPVTPGTKFVTIGGSIASDVHGKNHHSEGSFTDHVACFQIMLANGDIVTASRAAHAELFHATCGGMGLTGVIIDATLQLKPIKSGYIDSVMIKAPHLSRTIELLEEYNSSTYSLAWLDCFQTGDHLGRSIIMLGEHSQQGELNPAGRKSLAIPIDMPNILLNHYTGRTFNTLYYHSISKVKSEGIILYEPFFYPLDRIHHWNRIYGTSGFTQYQFVIPKAAGLEGLAQILNHIVASPYRPFLAVLKHFGTGNDNYLSFPMEGYTLAMDFKLQHGLFPFLEELDRMVLDYDGRLYLSKDARMSEETFKKSYPRWEQFSHVRKQYGSDKVFHSLQSQRLGI